MFAKYPRKRCGISFLHLSCFNMVMKQHTSLLPILGKGWRSGRWMWCLDSQIQTTSGILTGWVERNVSSLAALEDSLLPPKLTGMLNLWDSGKEGENLLRSLISHILVVPCSLTLSVTPVLICEDFSVGLTTIPVELVPCHILNSTVLKMLSAWLDSWFWREETYIFS